jgi:hypothetical protein
MTDPPGILWNRKNVVPDTLMPVVNNFILSNFKLFMYEISVNHLQNSKDPDPRQIKYGAHQTKSGSATSHV